MLPLPEEFFLKNRYLLLVILIGLILVGVGVLFFRGKGNLSGTKVEVLNSTTESQNAPSEIVAEISGQIEKPGVYKLQNNSRVEDLIVTAGGFSAGADRDWIAKNLNRAARVSDGQKVYIPKTGESEKGLAPTKFDGGGGVVQGSLININTADLKTLDTLPGIGPVYGQNIIEHRPYSNVEDLLSKEVLKQSVYEKIKNNITVY